MKEFSVCNHSLYLPWVKLYLHSSEIVHTRSTSETVLQMETFVLVTPLKGNRHFGNNKGNRKIMSQFCLKCSSCFVKLQLSVFGYG